MSQPAPIAVALDAPDLETAARWAGLVTPHVSTVKIGLEMYLRYGPGVVASIRGASGVSVFLDLKLHDIPATVAGAARAVARLTTSVIVRILVFYVLSISLIVAAAASPLSRLRTASTTCAPLAARSRAATRPMPLLAPVTITVRPFRSGMF